MKKHMETPIWVLNYLYDWEPDRGIWPETHTYCFRSEKEAYEEKAKMTDPSKYWVTKTWLQD